MVASAPGLREELEGNLLELAENRKRLEALEIHDPERERALAVAADAASQLLLASQREGTEKGELTDLDPGSLAAAVKRIVEGWKYEETSLQEANEKAATLRDQLKQRREAEARTKPSRYGAWRQVRKC